MTLDPTARGGLPLSDRLILSRSRIARIRQLAGQEALVKSSEYDEYVQLWLSDESCDASSEELAVAAHYAKGVVDALAFLTDPDHPDPMLAEILGLPVVVTE